MMILGKERDKLIDSLNLTESMRKLTKGEFVHDELEFRCNKVKYSLGPEDFSPAGLDVIPLWESETSIMGFYLDEEEQPNFIHYYIEDINDYEIIGNTIDDLVKYLIGEYVEFGYEDEVKQILLK